VLLLGSSCGGQDGLPPNPGLGMLSRYFVLSPFPPSYRDPTLPLPATAHAFRELTLDVTKDGITPPWIAVASHGGSGSAVGALTCGRPSALIP
jgi:hypothetical protein